MAPDNALTAKSTSEIEIQKLWAAAFSERKVPTNVIGSNSGGSPVGSDTETKAFM